MERICDFSTSDFARLVKTTSFVDNTMMIKDIFCGSSKILITAPPQFGKSTNINMVKRFLEIDVSQQTGVAKCINTTNNYKLFKDNNLEICSDNKFFNEHFGKHPVVCIDFNLLASVCDFANMLDVFRTIITKTFREHSFLLNIRKNLINKIYFYNCQLTAKTDESDLISSFEHLTKVLYGFFMKEVVVLIDNCDAFVNSLLFKKSTPDAQKMINFITATMDNLLKNNTQCVGQVVLTGVLPVTGDGFPFYENNIDSYYFLDGHKFCKYYGLISGKLDVVLKKVVTNDEDRNKIKMTINKYFDGYRVEDQVHVYNFQSVLQYMCRKQVRSYWSNQKHIKNFKPAFEISEIRDRIEELVSGHQIQLDISQVLTTADILVLNEFIRNKKIQGASFLAVNTFFHLLYHFGCLTTNKVLGWGFVSLKIPNEEIKCEFEKNLNSNWVLNNGAQLASNEDISVAVPDTVYELADILESFVKVIEQKNMLVKMLESYSFKTLLLDDWQISHNDRTDNTTPLVGLINIFEKFTKGFEEKNRLITMLENYITHLEENTNSEAFHIHSVLKCLCIIKTPNSSTQTEYLKPFLKIEPDLIQRILMGKTELLLSKSQSVINILKRIKKIITNSQTESLGINVTCILLYYFGCLAMTREDEDYFYLTIPDDEIKYSLARAHFEVNQTLYCNNQDNADKLRKAVCSMTFDSFVDFHLFGDAVWHWYKNCPQSKVLLPYLFLTLKSSPDCKLSAVKNVDCYKFIQLNNQNQISLYITIIESLHVFESADAFTVSAQDVHKKVMNHREKIFNKNSSGCGTVLFVISQGFYCCKDKSDEVDGIRITCTSQFKNNEKVYSHRILKFNGHELTVT